MCRLLSNFPNQTIDRTALHRLAVSIKEHLSHIVLPLFTSTDCCSFEETELSCLPAVPFVFGESRGERNYISLPFWTIHMQKHVWGQVCGKKLLTWGEWRVKVGLFCFRLILLWVCLGFLPLVCSSKVKNDMKSAFSELTRFSSAAQRSLIYLATPYT